LEAIVKENVTDRKIGDAAAEPALRAETAGKHAARHEPERDARAIVGDLGRGMSVAEICSANRGTRKAFYRRYRIAEKFTCIDTTTPAATSPSSSRRKRAARNSSAARKGGSTFLSRA
jgi:hypothetical protein